MHRRYEPSNIPIEILRSFISILDAGSFTKAAARLNMTQPAISAHIKRMQNLVGEELFRKEGVGISLTEKGETVCRYARRILALNDQILWSGRSEKRVRIGVPSILAGKCLSALKAGLEAESFSSVQIVDERSDFLLKRMNAGYFDAALAFSSVEVEDIAPKIEWKEPLVWICHPDFVLSPGAPLPLLSWPNSVTDRIAVTACEQAQIHYTSEFIGDQLSALFEALQLKLGYLCVPERSVPAGFKIAREYFLPKLPPMHAGIYTNQDFSDARLDTLVKCMAKVLAPPEGAKPEKDKPVIRPAARFASEAGVQAEKSAPPSKSASKTLQGADHFTATRRYRETVRETPSPELQSHDHVEKMSSAAIPATAVNLPKN